MTWNYRVVRGKSKGGEEYLSIRTAWYDEDKENPHSIGDTPMYPAGEDIVELQNDVVMMGIAIHKPILNEEDFEKKVLTIQDHK